MISAASGTRLSAMRMNYHGDLPIPDVFDPLELSSRPHDPTSKGVVGGEGAAALVLETEQSAAQRDIKPIARIVSYASRFVPTEGMSRGIRSGDSKDLGARGSAAAIRLAIEAALADAGISANEIALVISHGMGDPSCDVAEREAIQATVAKAPMVATIAALGHSGAASGMIDLLTGALSLAKGIVPPTPFADSVRPQANFFTAPATLNGEYVLCLSHTSEGNAIAIVLANV